MVLPKKEILDRMRNFGVSDPRSLVITPLLYAKGKEKDVFDEDSVDLRLGCYFLLPKTLDQPFFSPDAQTGVHPASDPVDAGRCAPLDSNLRRSLQHGATAQRDRLCGPAGQARRTAGRDPRGSRSQVRRSS
jgi:hypothetical protein